MYINGAPVASNTAVNLTASLDGQIGPLHYNTTGGANPGSQMCNANFSSFWVWNNRVLTAQEAAQFYANPGSCSTPARKRDSSRARRRRWPIRPRSATSGSIRTPRRAMFAWAFMTTIRRRICSGNRPAFQTRRPAAGSPRPLREARREGWRWRPALTGWCGRWTRLTTCPVMRRAQAAAVFSRPRPSGRSLLPLRVRKAHPKPGASIWITRRQPRRFSPESVCTGRRVAVQLQGSTNIPFGLQVSTNLVNWQPLDAPGVLSNGLWFFQDTNTGALPRRFYRGEWP